MELKILPAYDFPEEIHALFSEYTDMLIREEPIFEMYLGMQNYEAELRDLRLKYGPPGGRLYIVFCGEEAVASIALRQLDETRCEIKRLYVRPAYRGRGIAKTLVQKILDDARQIGYSQILLDTVPFLKTAIALYRSFGFQDVPPYLETPVSGTLFLGLTL